MLQFGVGTAWYKPTEEKIQALGDSIALAYQVGFRCIDNAEMYQNENYVGPVLQKLPREELYIVSKISAESTHDVAKQIEKSLQELQVDYLDAYLIHAPFGHSKSLRSVWSDMEALVSSKKTRAIGVSNFRIQDLKEIMADSGTVPICNQIELHPYLFDSELVEFCQANNILVTSYGGLTPITSEKNGPLTPVLERLANEKGVTTANIVQSWILHQGCGIITTSSKQERLEEYLKSPSVKLSAEEMSLITETGSKHFVRRFWKDQFKEYDVKFK